MSSAAYREGRDRYVERLIDAGSTVFLPELARGPWRDALFRVCDRRGVGVMALPQDALTEPQLRALLRFRFAQYLAVGFVDPDLAYRERLEHEPAGAGEPAAVNFVAFSSGDGRILASLALRSAPEAPPGTTLRARERPLLPLEEHFGWGALNRLKLLPDLPLERIRELGRFVKNQRLGPLGELGTRGVIEVCLAACHTLTGPLRMEVEAFVGEFEDVVARRHLELLHTPFAMLRGGLPAFASEHLLRPALDGRARYPFAVLVSDMRAMADRLAAVEAALAEPGIEALVALARDSGSRSATSSLAPPDGIPELANTPLPQRELPLPARRRARALGGRLQRFPPFTTLSETESTTLRSLLDEVEAGRGEVIVTRGEPSDGLYLIAEGEAEVRPAGPLPPSTLVAGDCFGEIGLLTGGPRTADVVARSALKLLRLSEETYRRYLRGLPDIDRGLGRLALLRAAAHLQPGP
jgi:CRP-like cAMP-binding protein